MTSGQGATGRFVQHQLPRFCEKPRHISGDAAAALIGDAAFFDTLITHMRMPGSRDGVALASCWHEKAPGRPVLFVSGHAGSRLDLDALGPHQAVLHKPFRRASLLSAVQRLLAKMRRRT